MSVHKSTLLSAAALFMPALRGQLALFTHRSAAVSDGFGYAAALVGDADRDGWPDIAVGAFTPPSVAVLSGRDGHVVHTFAGIGPAVGGVGDVDGDGHADVLVGSYGTAAVLSGRTGAVVHSWSGTPGDGFGTCVAGAGDVDADGTPDAMVGTYLNGFGGYAAVFSGRTGAQLHRLSSLGFPGRAVAGGADLDGDGHAELIVGNPFSNAGGVLVYSGRSGQLLWYDFPRLIEYGRAVAVTGDLDGDGTADVIAGGTSIVRVLSGRTGALLYSIPASAADFGISVAATGDLDADGRPELLVAQPHTGHGTAFVFSGRNGSLLLTLTGTQQEYKFGLGICSAGDVNRDGVAEFVVTAWQAYPGVARVYAAGTLATAGVGCGAAGTPTLASSRLRIGQALSLSGGGVVPGAAGYCAVSAVPALPIVLGAGCAIHLDLATLFVLSPLAANAGGAWATSLPLPNDPNLLDALVALQAVFIPTSGPRGGDVSNGVYARIVP